MYARMTTKKPSYYRLKYRCDGIDTQTDDFSLSSGVSKAVYNFKYADGVLSQCDGLNTWTMQYVDSTSGATETIGISNDFGTVVDCWHYKRTATDGSNDDRIVVLFDDGTTYELATAHPELGLIEVVGATFVGNRLSAINYRLGSNDVLLISGKDDSLTVYNGVDSAYIVNNAPKITSMCVHYERLFVTGADSDTLWFSDDLDPTNWNVSLDQAGYITFADERGKLLKVVSFLDYLYIFRQYGITRVSAYGQQEDFSVSHLFTTAELTYADTICVCGDKILFLCKDGLYLFDGNNAKKVLPQLDGLFEGVDNSTAVATVCKGKYVLACRLSYDDGISPIEYLEDGFVNNALIVIDVNTMRVEEIIRGVDVRHLSRYNTSTSDNVLMTTGGDTASVVSQLTEQTGNAYDLPLQKVCVFPCSDLGESEKFKFVKRLTLYTEQALTVHVSCDQEAWNSYQLNGSQQAQTVPLNLRCKTLRLAFSSSTNAPKVRNAQLTYCYY